MPPIYAGTTPQSCAEACNDVLGGSQSKTRDDGKCVCILNAKGASLINMQHTISEQQGQ